MDQMLRVSQQPVHIVCLRFAIFNAVSDSAHLFSDEQGGSKARKRIEDDLSFFGKLINEKLQHVFGSTDVLVAESGW
jgi:hypothetical protein